MCSMVPVPDEADEDARRCVRERTELISERIGLTNRIGAVLATLGVSDYNPLLRNRCRRLAELRTGLGEPLPANAHAAYAIAEAVLRPSTRCVPVKTDDQLDLQALHRVRSRLVGQRTAVINQIRSFLLERGIAVRQGPRFLRQQLPEILAKRIDVLSPRMIGIIEDLSGDWRRLDERIERVTEEIQQLAHGSESCRQLMTVPGIGETAS